ncbi:MULTISPECIES: FCD domain-containing protein [Cellulosimicrobium]|uniref:FCD domain-containing protein n=1 Tax=Cellulosimicrobium sp. ES-005 TaxID=3163031 RepID=A0AAU8G3I6_9MICO|nr:FCD domain-containing protein [Cellulosimicrobium cellulans]MCO7272228.1 FCD domain-containing protein [Cellulosimicrobium cellulans]
MNDREGAMLALAHAISTSDVPVGTRNAQRELAARGMVLSESSVSRLLREMDRRGWTTPAGTKGRTLSAEGRRRAAEAVLAERTSDSLQHAVRDVQDLLDLLRARQAVESAVAADAARNPSGEGVAELRRLCSDHANAVGSMPMIEQPGLQFHRGVVELASNRMLKLAADMMLAPHLDRVEAVLDAILSTRRDEERVVAEHRDVLERIEARDPAGAQAAMEAHFDDMIAAAENALVGSGGALVERLLGWVEAVPDVIRR